MRNILLCIDFNKPTKALVSQTATIAAATGAQVWVTHVADPDPDLNPGTLSFTALRKRMARELPKEFSQLKKIAEELQDLGAKAEPHIIAGEAVEAILEEAAALQADLLVVAYTPHSFFYRLFLGENTPELMRKATIPVLIVPTPAKSKPTKKKP